MTNPPPLPTATASHLPRWRGFNLLEKFQARSRWSRNEPFSRADFRMISELGFNFVRLPMDYRIWIKNGDWNQIDEAAFPEIDQAIEYGAEYGIHVCINFHRAPGFTVGSPEARDLWSDPEAQRVCAAHWAYFARRYKGIPNERLSFNLMNEPMRVPPEAHRFVVKQLVDAIHREDPARLIIADGRKWGNAPCFELADLGIAQATRGYLTLHVSFYGIRMAGHGHELAEPLWPMPRASAVVKAPDKDEAPRVFRLEGPFEAPAVLRVVVDRLGPHSELELKADGLPMAHLTWEWGAKTRSTPWTSPDWQKAETWNLTWEGETESAVQRTLEAQIPAGTKAIEVSAKSGWAVLHAVGITPWTGDEAASREFVFAPWESWKISSVPVRFDPADGQQPFKAAEFFDRAWLKGKMIAPWKELEARGVGVFVGEWGPANRTPHPIALAFMRDCLENWKEAGWGWALWNFRGHYGVLDSGRTDVEYEDFQGHKLDRAMLDLLRNY